MKKFFNKKSNILSVVFAVLGLAGILVMLIVPHGGKYTRKYTELDKDFVKTYEFKGGKIYSSTKVDGEYIAEDVLLGEYVIEGGKISYKVPLTGLSVEVGEINAFRLKAHIDEDSQFTCLLTIVFFVIACLMTVAGAVGIIYGLKPEKKKATKKSSKK